jgi:hypothetical protein
MAQLNQLLGGINKVKNIIMPQPLNLELNLEPLSLGEIMLTVASLPLTDNRK